MGRVLAIDPGVTSGLAFCRYDGIAMTFHATDEAEQLTACDVAAAWGAHSTPGDTIICEAYRITEATVRKSRQAASLEIIGFLRWLAHRGDFVFVLQSASDAKRFMTDAKLKALGWWRPTPGGHTNDAQRHLGTWLGKQGYEAVLRAGQ